MFCVSFTCKISRVNVSLGSAKVPRASRLVSTSILVVGSGHSRVRSELRTQQAKIERKQLFLSGLLIRREHDFM